MAAAALGSCAGALSAPRMTRRFGPGPMMLTALILTPLTQLPLLLASPGHGWQITIGAALAVQLLCAAAVGTTQRSISWGGSGLSHEASPGLVNGVCSVFP